MKNQLLFLWIKETQYTCFSDNGFCFSSEYDISFDSFSKKLVVQRNNNVNVFDEEKNISNITAVVGNNGAGKSTLLKFLLNLNTYSRKWNRKSKNRQSNDVFFIAVYLIDGCIVVNNCTGMGIYENINGRERYVRGSRLVAAEYKIRTLTTIYLSLDSTEDIPTRNNNSRFIPLTKKSINRIRNLFIESRRNKKNPTSYQKSFDFESMLMSDFYTSDFAKELFLDRSDTKMYIRLDANLPKNYGSFDTNDARLILIINLFKELEDEITSNGYSTKDHKLRFFLKGNMKHLEFEDYVKLILSTIDEYQDIEKSYYENALNEIGYFFSYGNKTELSKTFLFEIENARYLIDMIKNKDTSFIYKFLSFELNKSDGELAYLKHFAYLYAIANYSLGKRITIDKDILLMIDEIDVHLHPEWQRRLISNTIKVIQNIFYASNTQVILTTHSPIVLSDFPTQNIIFIKKNDLFDRIVFKRTTSDDCDYRTFGANIFDLYNDSFFFEGKTIVGDYAKNYINNLYSIVNTKGTFDHEDLLKKIDLIGEPIIRKDLLNLMNRGTKERWRADTLQKNEIIDILKQERKRVDELIRQLEERKDD